MSVGTEQGHSKNEVEKGNRDILGHVVDVFEYILTSGTWCATQSSFLSRA